MLEERGNALEAQLVTNAKGFAKQLSELKQRLMELELQAELELDGV